MSLEKAKAMKKIKELKDRKEKEQKEAKQPNPPQQVSKKKSDSMTLNRGNNMPSPTLLFGAKHLSKSKT